LGVASVKLWACVLDASGFNSRLKSPNMSRDATPYFAERLAAAPHATVAALLTSRCAYCPSAGTHWRVPTTPQRAVAQEAVSACPRRLPRCYNAAAVVLQIRDKRQSAARIQAKRQHRRLHPRLSDAWTPPSRRRHHPAGRLSTAAACVFRALRRGRCRPREMLTQTGASTHTRTNIRQSGSTCS
jgi:hypothetical protein